MIVLYNPHVDDFLAAPPHFALLKRRPLKKYGFLIGEALRKYETIHVLIDGTASAFINEKIFHHLPGFLRNAIANVEYRLWLRGNNFAPRSVVRVPAKTAAGHVLLAFAYKAATGKFQLRREILLRQKAVVFHLSHYFVYTAQKAENIRTLPNAWLGGDSDIRGNAYFREYFGWYDKDFLVLPFAVAPRFQVRRAYADRSPLCVATGSFHDLTRESGPGRYVDYLRTSGYTSYHPLREAIYAHREELRGSIQCNIAPYRDYSVKKGRLQTLISHLRVSQKKYFSVDIVELYNDHRMAVVGEELVGFPALGAFEAMACGCTLVAKEDCYRGLGFIPNTHFVPYDGSLNGLFDAIGNADEMYGEIAAKGNAYVTREFTPEAVAARWNSALWTLNQASS